VGVPSGGQLLAFAGAALQVAVEAKSLRRIVRDGFFVGVSAGDLAMIGIGASLALAGRRD
jgi:hypothetical protein